MGHSLYRRRDPQYIEISVQNIAASEGLAVEEVSTYIDNMSMSAHYKQKIGSREEVVAACADARKKKLIIGFTSGVFDLLHAGHVDYLAQARAQCDMLIVGLNSDSSVRKNKGEHRPIVPEQERAKVLAGLESVSAIFVFDDANNNRNIELLRPDIYFKAGDYAKEKLSSAPIVEGYGGKVVLVPMQQGLSSSAIIGQVLTRYSHTFTDDVKVAAPERRPAIFLDRDGTINEHIDYLHEPAKFALIPGVLEAMKRLSEKGYRLVVTTNQPGIGLGYFSKEDLFRVNSVMLKQAHKAGIKIDKIYYCPHSEAENCLCRKPHPGMVERAVRELNIDLAHSFVVGDMTVDVMLAKNAGCRSVLVQTGVGGKDGKYDATPHHVAKDLGAAAEFILTLKK